MPYRDFTGVIFRATVETFNPPGNFPCHHGNFPSHRGNFQGHLETFQTTVEIFYPESFCHLRSLHKHVPLEMTILMQIYLFIVSRKYSMMGVVRMGVVLLPRQVGPHIGTRVQLGTFSEFGSSKGPHFFQGPHYLHFRLKNAIKVKAATNVDHLNTCDDKTSFNESHASLSVKLSFILREAVP